MPLPVSIGDRFAAAWRAFRQNTKPDPDAFQKWLAARQADQRVSIDKLGPFDRAAVDSVAGGTTNAERLFDQLLAPIEALPFADQMDIVKFIVRSNPKAVRYPAFRAWSTRNAAAVTAASLNPVE